MAQLPTLNLPKVNGKYEFGIAVAVDPGLTDAEKVPMLSIRDKAPMYAAAWAHMKGYNHPIEVAGAAMVALANWASPVDGDSVALQDADEAVLSYFDGHKAEIEEMTSSANLQRAGSMIVATKIHWFSTNHHTGTERGKLVGYPEKVYKATLSPTEDATIDARVVSAVHRSGHWASTKRVLRSLGAPFKGADIEVSKARGHWGEEDPDVTITRDAELRVTSNPAGTAEVFVVAATFKAMCCHESIFLVPGLGDFEEYADHVEQVMASPLEFHVGALYLINHKPKVVNLGHKCLGRCGSFLNIYRKHGSLVKSPKLANYQSEEDYDDSYHNDLMTLKAEATAPEGIHQLLKGQMQLSGAHVVDMLKKYGKTVTTRQQKILEQLGNQ